jgi:dephospho-CoA kinase/pantetheine-phosphate adenylyltransferase
MLAHAHTNQEPQALVHAPSPRDTTVVYAGTFDPFTKGHLDVAAQAGRMFGKVIIAIGVNPSKTCMFTPEERKLLIERELEGVYGNFEVESFRGLLAHYAHKKQATALVRGVRNITDFASEIQLASVNREQSGRTELSTLFCPPRREFEFVSSSATKELLRNQGDVRNYVSPRVEVAMRMKSRGGDVQSFLTDGDATALPVEVAREIVLGRWMRVAGELGIAEDRAIEVGRRLVDAYEAPGRHYHNLEHIAEGLLSIDGFVEHLDDSEAFILAWLFHDFVYDPRSSIKGDNEMRSKEALESCLKDTPISSSVVERAGRLIERTIDHTTVDGDSDGAYFIDNDLWILGASPARYLRYTRQIRVEYGHYDAVGWAAGRVAFLESMASRPRIFKTARFQEMYGHRVAANVEAEISTLVWGRVIAVTGTIGSGKSSVMAELKDRGFVCESADLIGREVCHRGSDVVDAIVAHFGKSALDENGDLDRRALRRIVFADVAERKALEAIVHPAIEARAFEVLKEHVRRAAPHIAYELPLLFETGQQHKGFLSIVTVDANDETRLQRVMKRDTCSLSEAQAVLSAQMPAREMIAGAQVVIRNDGDLEDLRREIVKMCG